MKKLVVGNWKMNPETVDEARQLVLSFEHRMHLVQQSVDVVVCPPAVYLAPLAHYSHLVGIGAQDVSWADCGAYTGQVSAGQLAQWDVAHVILGHSERRMYCRETDQDVNAKLLQALRHRMHPVVCLGGEPGARKSDMRRLVTRQFNAVTKGLDKPDYHRVIFAYEPIWAISTMRNSKPATGDHAAELVDHIRGLLARKIGKERAKLSVVLYGGTVNAENVHEFARYPTISGALVGGASLGSQSFWRIVEEFSRESIHKK